MFNPIRYENSRGGGYGVLQVIDAAIVDDHERQRFVPLKRTELSGEIAGPLASLCVRHQFSYAAVTCNRVLEVRYRFPLPGDAAVTGVRVRFGAVTISTVLADREQAVATYAAAKEAGQQAAMLAREAPDVFTLQIAGVKPDEDVIVETDYVQLVQADGPGWTVSLPLTTAPRFVRNDELGTAHANGQPLAILRDPGHRFALDLTLLDAAAVTSNTHELDIKEAGASKGDSLRVMLAAGTVMPDRDFSLAWQPHREAARPHLSLHCHDDVESDHLYFLAQVAPPRSVSDQEAVARETLILVDHSGSMTGPKWAAADWAVERLLLDLNADDYFGLCLFHNDTAWHRPGLAAATPATVAEAVAWMKARHDSGGTNLGIALEEALRMDAAPGKRTRNLLVITDAQVTDDARILRLAQLAADQPAHLRRRISVLCIDAAPNSFLARQLAERGGGVAKFLTSSPEEIDIATALDGVLAAWEQPLYANLGLTINRAELETSGQRLVTLADGTPAVDLGDLPAGQARWVVGRTARAQAETVVLRLVQADGQVLAQAETDPTRASHWPQIRSLFGAGRINVLEYLLTAGYDLGQLIEQLERLGYSAEERLQISDSLLDLPDERVYAETLHKETTRALRQLLLQEALAYQLPSSVTSLVAVRHEAGKPVEGIVIVANALPSGWAERPRRFLPPLHVMSPSARAVRPASHSLPGVDTGALPTAASMPMMAALSQSELAAPAQGRQQRASDWTTVYADTVHVSDGSALLYDSGESEISPPAPTIISGLRAEVRDGASSPDSISKAVQVRIYIEDRTTPRASVRLFDLVRLGERPLNLVCDAGERIIILLADPDGFFAGRSVHLTLALRW